MSDPFGTYNTKYALDVSEVSPLVNTLKNVLHTILATPHLLLDQEYEPFEYWGLEEYHTYVKEEHVVFTADDPKKVFYMHISVISCTGGKIPHCWMQQS